MASNTVKILMVCFIMVILFNTTHYIFFWSYKPLQLPPQRLLSTAFNHSAPSNKLYKKHSFRTQKNLYYKIKFQWTQLLCESNATEDREILQVQEELDSDFRDHSTTTVSNNFYYYDGIRRGPVMCPVMPLGLGPMEINNLINIRAIKSLYILLEPGGIYSPVECVPRQTVGIIVPFRGLTNHLLLFLYALHPFLIKQQLEYRIFVIQEYNKTQPSNRGMLFNVGFTEAQRLKPNGGWRCLIFHEPNLLPVDSRNLYRCSSTHPIQLLDSVDNESYNNFGGAIAIKPSHFLIANGFSNSYRGENVYNDLYRRLLASNIIARRNNASYAKYTNIENSKDVLESTISQISAEEQPVNLVDGLSTIYYTVVNTELKRVYTLLTVDPNHRHM